MASLSEFDHGYQVFKTHFATLVDQIQPELDLCDGLLSVSIISEEEYLFATDEKKKEKHRTRKLLFKTLQSIRSKGQHFEAFCNLLSKSELTTHQKWASQLKSELIELSRHEDISSKENESLKVLKNQLSVLKRGILQSDENVEGKLVIMKEFIRGFIVNSLEVGVSFTDVSQQLEVLCYRDMVVYDVLVDWTFDELKRLYDVDKHNEEYSPLSEAKCYPKTSKKFFSRKYVTNCLLLCKTVASCDRANYGNFLSKFSHEFDEVSFSHSTDETNKLNPYIIAKIESTSEIYIAFRGEPRFDVWQETEYSTFSEGISFQASRVPIRFFIEQIRNNYSIIFTGFSMGGLLALSVYASLWKDTCLSINDLLQNVACITFGTPLIPLENLETTLKSVPNMKENNHLVIMEDDLVPRLLQFSEVRSSKKGQFPKVGELIFNKLASYAKQKEQDSVIDLTDLKVILQDKNLAMTVDTKIFGKCHYMYTDMSNVSVSLLSSGAVPERLKVPDIAELELMFKLNKDIMAQHTLSVYENNLIKAKLIQLPSETGTSPQLKEVEVLNPEVASITFYRHGDEIALVLQGENLWFCSKIRITSKSGSRVIDTMGADATSRSIHFNYVPKNENDLLIEKDAESVEIVYYSYFAKSKKRKIPVSFKGQYHVSFRQRQVAILTPDQVIMISFLCALLEVNTGPRSHSTSSRFKAIRKFLDEVVRIVPLESIIYAIAFGPDENAWKCATAFLSTDVTIPPSFDLSQALGLACTRLTLGVTPDILQDMQRQVLFQHWTSSASTGLFPEPVDLNVHSGDDDITVSAGPIVKTSSADKIAASVSFQRLSSLSSFHQQSENSKFIIQKLEKLKHTVDLRCKLRTKSRKNVRLICGLNIEKLYCEDSQSSKLLNPIVVLKNGRKELQDFQKEAEEELFQFFTEGEDKREKQSNNEKMISTLHRIFTNDLFLCSFVLGAFMQQQIEVPFVDSTIDTARILQTTESPPAVGVWALFCLNMIDFQKMTSTKKHQALIVKVEKYIKGIFAKGSERLLELFPEQLYAGKLQFIAQCLVSYVSCNTNYISYSFERQLACLCEERDIKPSTRVQDMIKNWNRIFKDDLLFYIMDQFRPTVARWILWCLSIHHLREELASHTTVGIIGLSNSGKSCLVKKLFKQKVISGTTTMERTTVPFLYNLEGLVDGLDVIDFPGMDDKDENVLQISHILLQISQLVIVVVDYRRCSTKPVSQWIEILKNSGVPVLICLTHADKLFAATCLNENGDLKSSLDDARRLISQELEKLCEILQQHPSWKVDLFSFALDSDSKLNTEILSDVGVSFSYDVGVWIETELREHMDQPQIANKLKEFIDEELKSKTKGYKGSPPDVRGLDIIAETSFNVTQEGHTFHWEGYGLEISFPSGAITKKNQCFIKLISSGHYKLPDDTELVSSLYWLYFPEKFLKPVDVQIQHCCPPSLCEQKGVLNFIKGRCDQEVPYTFKIRSDASFSCNNQKGLLSLHSFCLLGVIRSFRPQPTVPDRPPQIHSSFESTLCVVKVYSKWEGNQKCLFDFVFLKDLESFHTAIEKKYLGSGWHFYVKEFFEFESVSLTISIAQDTDLKDWNYLKRNPGKIKRTFVNCCRPESCPNHCLQFEWSKDDPPNNMSCPVKISMGVHHNTEPIELNLSLPLVDHSHSEVTTTATQQQQQQQQRNELHDYDSSLNACNVMRVLRDSGFSFMKSSRWLMTELGIETEHKRTLFANSQNDNCTAMEEAIDWWISNKSNSWSLLVKSVSKVEEKTSQKMKTVIPQL